MYLIGYAHGLIFKFESGLGSGSELLDPRKCEAGPGLAEHYILVDSDERGKLTNDEVIVMHHLFMR